jgi:hypothetical protein
VGFPSEAVEPREKRNLDAALGWDANHVGRFLRGPLC